MQQQTKMVEPLKTEAAPLTPEAMTEAVKEVDWEMLCWCLHVPPFKRGEIQDRYPAKDRRRVLVDWWCSTNPAPSWRSLIYNLDCIKKSLAADKIRHNAEPVEDPTFTLSNVITAVESVQGWKSLAAYLDVPSEWRRSREEMLQYFITTVPNASWQILAGGLYYRQEQAALERVAKKYQRQPEATLTVANLCSVLQRVEEWDCLGMYLGMPSSIRSEIKKKYSDDTQRKQAMLEAWRNYHPAPSWMLVATALYSRLIGGDWGKYHNLLLLVNKKYLKAAAALPEQPVNSADTSPTTSASPRKESDALPTPQRGTFIFPLSPQSPPASIPVSTLGSSFSKVSIVDIEYSDLEIKEKVGCGGSATVSKGRWISKNMTVAIKISMELVEKEVRILSSLDHPSIVRYYGTASQDNVHYIVTEFAENRSVCDYIFKENRQPPLFLRLLWAAQVAEGMVYLHNHKLDIIHRDLKSSNVVLTSALNAKICDLGSARMLEHTTQNFTAVGTSAWIAPEILQGDAVSKSCDVYSYGVLLFEIVTEKVPFQGVHNALIPSKTVDGQRPTIPDTCEPHLADLIKRCWDQDPKARPGFQKILEALSGHWSIEYSDLKFEESVGIGGFGTVYKGRWISKNKTVAIKMMIVLVEREVRILSSLDHPSIIQYYGTATENTAHFIVTEFAENGSIYDYIHEEHKKPPLSQILLWAAQVAEGMVYLHQRDIIHRDLKSSNVVLTSELNAKICDLGSARSLEHTARQTTAVGTYAWMAPEMLQRKEVSKSCDVYSYGVLLFEIATQEKPFHGVLPYEIPSMTVDGKRPTIPGTCDPRLAELIRRCWKQDAKARPTFKEILGT